MLGIISGKKDSFLTLRTSTEAVPTLTQGRMAGWPVHSLVQTRVFPKDCSNWSPFFQLCYLSWSLSCPHTSFGQRQPLPNWFPCPGAHSPQMCSPHTPESDLKLKFIFSSAKSLSTVPCCQEEKSYLWHKKVFYVLASAHLQISLHPNSAFSFTL